MRLRIVGTASCLQIFISGFVALVILNSAMASGSLTTGPVKTVFGEVNLHAGLPATEADAQKLFDGLDTQLATQSYLWALPLVAFKEWEKAQLAFGATDTDLVVYTTYEDKLGILTANATTPYTMAFSDLNKTGALVIETPPGPIAGGFGDFWQRTVSDIGETGPDRGKGGKYLVIPPGQKTPAGAETDFFIVPFSRFNLMTGFRALAADPKEAQALIAGIKIYPYAERAHPKPTRLVTPGGRKWYEGQPRGLAYWESLHAALQNEVVDERDRFYLAMLRQLGIEVGKPFKPDARQTKILLEGAATGELIAKANTFNKRFANVRHWPDRRWEYALFIKNSAQRDEHYDQLLERTAWFYEAVTNTNGMVSKTPGLGQAYLGAYTDGSGAWLDGAKSYRLTVPANPPAKQFWSLTVYDTDTRVFVENSTRSADRSSRMDLRKNTDGSVDLFFGPQAPAGYERNWVQTVAGRPWFAYFRLYAPTEAYFDKSWKLPDIVEQR